MYSPIDDSTKEDRIHPRQPEKSTHDQSNRESRMTLLQTVEHKKICTCTANKHFITRIVQ